MPELATPGRYSLNLPIFNPRPLEISAPPPLPVDTSAVSQAGLYSSLATTLGDLPSKLMASYTQGQKRALDKKAQAVIEKKIENKDYSGLTFAPNGVTFKQPDPIDSLDARYKQAQLDALTQDSATRAKNAATTEARSKLYGQGGARDPYRVKPTLFDQETIEWGGAQPTSMPVGISPTTIDVNPSATSPLGSDLPSDPTTGDEALELMDQMEPSLGLLNDLPVDATDPANYQMPTGNLTAGEGGMPMAPVLNPQSTGVKMNIDGTLSKVALPAFNPDPLPVRAPVAIAPLAQFDPTAPVRKVTDARDPSSGIFTKIAPDGTKYQLLPGSNKWTAVKAGPDNSAMDDETNLIAESIINGNQPPVLTGLYKKSSAVRAALERKGYNLSGAASDWQATVRNLATMNGPQQLRLRQAVDFTYHSLDLIEDLGNEWKGGNFPILNKAKIGLAKQGALGPKAQSLAQRLEAQINDLVSELGTVYKGGNGSTNETLRLAAENLKADFSEQTLKDSVETIRKNLQIRANSLKNVRSTGGSPDNRYDRTPSDQPEPSATAPAPELPAQTKPKQVKQNGVTYTLQPDGSYK